MSRSYHTRKLIPRSFFPDKTGDWMTCKDGTVITAAVVSPDVVCLTAPWPSGRELDWGLGEANPGALGIVNIYFSNGYVSMYGLSYPQAWCGTGVWLLNKIRSLTRGKFSNV